MGDTTLRDIARIPDTQITTEWVWVTPEKAKAYLEYNVGNRNQRDKHLQKLVDDMINDRYVLTHQGIAFDEDGVMIDGQHRCIALIRANKPMWMLVTEGLPAKAKRLVDLQAKRGAADFLSGKNRMNKAAAVKVLLSLEELGYIFTMGQLKTTMMKLTHAEIQEGWDRWPDLDEIVELSRKASLNVNVSGPAGLAAAAVLYPETGKEFLTGLAEMDGLPRDDARLTLLKAKSNSAHGQFSHSAAFMAIKSAKFYAEGRPLGVLRAYPNEVLKVYPVKKYEGK